ncbi:MAG TPA: hypothetical protein VE871_10705 [Longimicrobium sp.]|nr:hypothetical protein [Longimicrobium sp.]
MKKLVLQLDSLRVESFATSHADDRVRGTVRGLATVTCPAEPQPNTVGKSCVCHYTYDGESCQGRCVTDASCLPVACTGEPSYAPGCVLPTRVC